MLTATVYKDDSGEWRWRIVHDNGNVLADSGEGYARKEDALHGLGLVTRAGSVDVVVEESFLQ